MSINGYVAFLDILGFKELVSRSSFDDDFVQYTDIINEATKTNNNLNYVTFSDCVVINTKSRNPQDFSGILRAVSEIVHRLLVEMSVPVCGCISAGTFSRLESLNNDVMIAGMPIVDAYQYEQKQDWVGVILSPSALKNNAEYLEKSNFDKCNSIEDARAFGDNQPWPFLVKRYHVIPFHNPNDFVDNSFDGYVVVPQLPPRSLPTLVLKDLEQYLEKLDALKLLAPTPSAQRKYMMTSNWIRDVVKKLEHISSWWKALEKEEAKLKR